MRRQNSNQQRIPIWRKLSKILIFLLFCLPIVPFFSYYPIIPLGANNSMNFELSLPLIWLVVFDIVAFFALIALSFAQKSSKNSQNHPWGPNFPGISDRRIFLLTIFPFWATISIFWSANPLRGILTAGIIWLLWFAVFAIIYLVPLNLAKMSKFSPLSKKPQNRLETAGSKKAPSQQALDEKALKTGYTLAKTPKSAQKLAGFDQKWLKKALLTTFLVVSVLISVFCWLQAILDILGLNRENTLLCAGCTYRSFGFPHPSGFAIEPQFMGNLLLAPTLTALFLLVWRWQNLQKREKRLLTGAAIILTATLFFTFSRGAIYAFVVALAILLLWALISRKKRWLALLTLPAISFIIALTAQGLFAEFGPTSETFGSGITKSIHQLSLGIVDLRPLAEENLLDQTTESGITDQGTTPVEEEEAFFEGYVAESTDFRLLLNRVAWQVWQANPRNLLFGVGLGAAGMAMHDFAPTEVTSPKEIVQNEGFSILLELGVVGILLLIFEILVIFCPNLFSAKFLDGRDAAPQKVKSAFWSHPALPLLCTLLVAYLITLNFFSGLPNALQIYLFPPLLYLIFFPDGAKIAKK